MLAPPSSCSAYQIQELCVALLWIRSMHHGPDDLQFLPSALLRWLCDSLAIPAGISWPESRRLDSANSVCCLLNSSSSIHNIPPPVIGNTVTQLQQLVDAAVTARLPSSSGSALVSPVAT